MIDVRTTAAAFFPLFNSFSFSFCVFTLHLLASSRQTGTRTLRSWLLTLAYFQIDGNPWLSCNRSENILCSTPLLKHIRHVEAQVSSFKAWHESKPWWQGSWHRYLSPKKILQPEINIRTVENTFKKGVPDDLINKFRILYWKTLLYTSKKCSYENIKNFECW